MSLKTIILILSSLISSCLELNLIPDSISPLIFDMPTTSKEGVLSIIFSFPSGNPVEIGPSRRASFGVSYKQFIGVTFPLTMKSDLNFDGSNSINYSCSINFGGVDYQLKAVRPTLSSFYTQNTIEKTTAYCQFEEDSLGLFPLKTGISNKYTLKLSFSITISTNFIRQISLFTSTSNNPDKIILDSLPVFGSLLLYNNYVSCSTKMLTVTDWEIFRTKGPVSRENIYVYPYNTFDLSITVQINEFISASDYLIVFGYSSNSFIAPSSWSSQAAGESLIQKSLSGNSEIKQLGAGRFYLDGITEDLVPNRRFKLVLTEWTALDTNVGNISSLSLMIFYKNTYSITSYTALDIMKISPSSVELQAEHPEKWDLWRNGAWPISFSFASQNELVNGGWILIQQTNTIDGSETLGNKFTFIASTCDFSENSFNDAFGTRNQCFPLRTDFEYPGKTSTLPGYKGSGFFFYMKGPIVQDKEYYVTVWAFADNCGGQIYDAVSHPTSAYAIPEFTLSIYKSINASLQNEDRFTSSGTQGILAQSLATSFNGKCYNNLITHEAVDMNNIVYTFTDAMLSTIKLNEDPQADLLLYKEFSDFSLFAQKSSWGCNSPDETDCVASSIKNSPSSEKFLYSSTKMLTSESYLLLKLTIPVYNYYDNQPFHQIPLPICNYVSTPGATGYTIPSGKLIVQLSSSWFEAGDPYTGSNASCFLSWAVDQTESLGPTQTSLIPESPQSVTSNYILANLKTGGSQFDLDNTSLPPYNSDSITRIVSEMYLGSDDTSASQNKWRYIASSADLLTKSKDQASAFTGENRLYFGLMTSCVRWISRPPTIKSLYTYLDIQIKWNFIPKTGDTTSLGEPSKNMRLIKLYPEGGGFQDTGMIMPSSVDSTSNFFYSHLAYGKSATVNGICLLELNGTAVQKMIDSSSNTLGLFILFGILLESDYSDPSSSYPIASLDGNAVAYGLQSQFSMSTENKFINRNPIKIPVLPYILRRYHNAQLRYTIDNIKETETSDADYFLNYPPSHESTDYKFFMGSSILITGISSEVTENSSNLLIPYYCPIFQMSETFPSGTSNIETSYDMYGFFPTVVGVFMNMTGYSTITSVNKYLAYKDTTRSTNNRRVTVLVASNPQKGYSGTGDTLIRNSLSSYFATLRFASYTDSLHENYLYVFNGKLNTAGSTLSCSGHVLLLSEKISLSSTVSASFGYLGAVGQYSPSSTGKKFWAFGKPFTSAVLVGLGDSSTPVGNILGTAVTSSTGNSSRYFVGVKRPSLDQFVNLNTYNNVGYSCTSNGLLDYDYMTNILLVSTSVYFILDWNPDMNSSNWVPLSTLTFDQASQNFQFDYAGNIKISLNAPSTLPQSASLVFGASSFSGNTICGVNTSHKGTNECTNANGVITCLSPFDGREFEICCYNVQILTAMSISSLKIVYLSNSEVAGLGMLMSSEIYNASYLLSNTGGFMKFTNEMDSLFKLPSAKINGLVYSHSNQEFAIGKVKIEISLGRAAVRGMKVGIGANLSKMKIEGITPRCQVSFGTGSESELGDILVDSCSLNLQDSNSTIQILLKNMIYKCGHIFSNTMYITIWPVTVINYSGIKYKISAILPEGQSIVTESSDVLPVISSTEMLNPNPPIVTDLFGTLCKVTPSHKIPSDPADYTFEFNLLLADWTKTSNHPNEVTIFWPFQQYGSYISNVQCWKSGLVNCYFEDEGILNIKFDTLPLASVSITVLGIFNPLTDDDLHFACTVNWFHQEMRTVLMAGSGKLVGGLNYSRYKATGALRLLPIVKPARNSNPRLDSPHAIRIAFDTAVGLSPKQYTFTSEPVIKIYFPQEYKLAWHNLQSRVSQIYEYYLEINSNILKYNILIPKSTVQLGNTITITMDNPAYAITEMFQFWEITLHNIINPSDVTNYKTARPFYVTVTNSAEDVVFRTFSNAISWATEELPDSSNQIIQWSKGISFTFDDPLRFVIDVETETETDQLQPNQLTIKTGRYLSAQFEIRTNSTAVPSASTLSLSDQTFKTSEATYILSSSYYQPLKFYIGCPCGTATGYYVLSFNSSDVTHFFPMAPVLVYVNATKSEIYFKSFSNMPQQSIAWVSLYSNDKNFDTLSIIFPSTQEAESPTISSIDIPPLGLLPFSSNPGPFITVTSSKVIAGFSYKAPQINDCYTWTSPTLDFAPLSMQASLTRDLRFKYANADIESNLSKNEIKFQFFHPSPVFVFCALTCATIDFPSNSGMIITNYSQAKSLAGAGTPMVKYYFNYFDHRNPVDILFGGLMRGMQYKLKCLIQTTETDVNLRTTVNTTLESGFSLFNNSLIKIYTPPTVTTQCMYFTFTYNPGTAAKKALIDFCQESFAQNGWQNTGCIICTDPEMNFINGMSLASTNRCINSSKLQKEEYLPKVNDTNSTAQISTSSALTLTICAVQDPLCQTDSPSPSTYETIFSNITESLKTTALIKTNTDIQTVVLTNLTTFSDKSSPDISSISSKLLNASQSGNVKWSGSCSGLTLTCYWGIVSSANYSNDSFNLWDCTDQAWCGKLKLSTKSQNYSTLYLKEFSNNTDYYLTIACLNDIPNTRLISDVIKIGLFSFNSTTVTNTTNNTSTNTTKNCTDPSKTWPNCNNAEKMTAISILLIIYLLITSFY